MKRLFACLSLLSVIILLFSSCGYSGSQKKKELRIGIDGLDSLEMWGKEGNIIAFLQELMDEAESLENYKIKFYSFLNNKAVDDFRAGRLDGYFSADVPPKTLVVSRSKLCLPAGHVIVVASDFPYTSFDEIVDVRGLRVGLPRNYSSQFVSDLNLDWIVVNYTAKKQKIDDLVDGSVEMVVIPLLPAYALSQGFYFSEIRLVSHLLDKLGIHLIMDTQDKSIISGLDNDLANLKSSGKFVQIAEKWNLFDVEFDND